MTDPIHNLGMPTTLSRKIGMNPKYITDAMLAGIRARLGQRACGEMSTRKASMVGNLGRSPMGAFSEGIAGNRGRARLQRLATARCHYNGQVSQATVANASASGAFLHSTWLPVVGHRLTVSFVCPGSQVWGISVVAEVVRISSGTGAAGEVRGFAVRWLKMRARGSLSCMSKFLDGMMGIEFRSSLPASTDLSRWEYSFEEGRLV
mgnify:CR=1 FL=1